MDYMGGCRGGGGTLYNWFYWRLCPKGVPFSSRRKKKNPLDHEGYGYFLEVLQMLVTLSSVSFPLSINCCICFLFSTSYKHKNSSLLVQNS